MKGGFWSDGVAVSELQAGVATALKSESLAGALPAIAEHLRALIPSHQSAVSYIPDGDFTRASHATSLSDKYAKYRSYDVMPTGKGIWAKIFEDGRPMRLTEAELYAHPRFRHFGDLKDERGLEHPPMPGWLAVPVRRRTGDPIGVLQLSDRLDGDYTEDDERLLESIAGLVAPTFELEYVQHELLETRQAYQELYDGAPDMYLSIDARTGRLQLCNQTTADRLGWSKQELADRPIAELYHPDCHDEVRASLARFRQEGHLENVRLAVRTRSGERIPVLLSARSVRDHDGQVTHSLSSWRDISDLEEAERELSEANEILRRSNSDLERFAYVASHDLQEPLRMVASFTELLTTDLGDQLTEQRQRWADFAIDGAHRAKRLIDGLLAYSRLGDADLDAESVDLHAVVDDVIRILAPQLEAVGGTIRAEGLPSVRGDAVQLYQIFQNLLSNGIRFGGDEPPVVEVSTEDAGEHWLISVSDNGRGIPAEHHDNVFLLFKRLGGADSGSGIGLAIVRRLLERMGSDIELESDEGAGATFRFTLPKASS